MTPLMNAIDGLRQLIAKAHPSADLFAFGKLLAYLTTGQTDVDQIRWPSWGRIARDCTARLAEQRPTLDDVE